MSDLFYLDVRQHRSNILIRYYQDGVEKMMKYNKYKPSLYRRPIHGESGDCIDLIKSEPLVQETFDSIWDANTAIRESSGTSKWFGNRNFNYTFLHENFKNTDQYDPSKIRVFYLDIECPSDSGFPEAALAEWAIDAMTIYDNIMNKYYIWSLYDFNPDDPELRKNNITPDMVVHKKFTNDYDLLDSMLSFWEKHCPVAVSGWHSSGFDLPYMYNRMLRLGLDPNRLSPWGSVRMKESEFQGRPVLSLDIVGVNDLDYLDLYKKNRFKTRESYKLNFIAHVELGKEKINFEEEASNLRNLNKVNPQKYQVYNIVDVQLVKLLDEKLGFMDVTFAVAYFAGINYSDVSSPVATWENIIYRHTIDKNIILPSKKDHDHVSYEGGFVLPPKVGKHKWVVSFDLNSLYPHLIEMYNISPETITDLVIQSASVDAMLGKVDLNAPDDVAVAPTGNTFRKDKQGIAGYMMNTLYKERKSIKKEMLIHEQDVIDAENGNNIEALKLKYNTDSVDDIIKLANTQVTLKDGGQMVRKILLNSFYGALANIYFNLFDLRLAESITKGGQLSIRWIGIVLNKALNRMLNTDSVDYLIYTDTDSVYISMEAVVNKCNMADKDTQDIVKFLDKFCEEHMMPIIENGYQELADYVNAYDQKMIMAREVISDNSIFCSKKRYAMSVWNSEGVQFKEPYIKTLGLDVVKSSTPEVCRVAMKETIKKMLNSSEEDVQSFIRDFKQKYKQFPVQDISFPRGVNKLEESYCRPDGSFRSNVTVPINSRASINYNRELRNLGLTDYEVIRNGDKIKFVHLTAPNRLQQNVIGFVDVLPEEFNLHHKIDYDTMFFKTYLKPMDAIMQLIGWEAEPKATLDMFFGEEIKKVVYDLDSIFSEDEDEDDD